MPSPATNDLEAMALVAQQLHEPLLGMSQPCAQDDDDEMSISLLEDESVDEEATFSLCDAVLGWVVLPLLLFVQFYMAFASQAQNDTLTLNQARVYYSIVLFVVASCLFRRTCSDQKIKSTLVLVLPEIAMDAVLLLILVNQVDAAYLTLLGSLLALSLHVCVSCVLMLVHGERRNSQPASDRDELEDSFSSGLLRTASIC